MSGSGDMVGRKRCGCSFHSKSKSKIVSCNDSPLEYIRKEDESDTWEMELFPSVDESWSSSARQLSVTSIGMG